MQGASERRHIVELLVRGWSDDRISRELALSKRTVQRRVRRLMQEHGCSSRFSLGFTLGLRLGMRAPGRPGGSAKGPDAPSRPGPRHTRAERSVRPR
ncbi:helix-turn-helix domain-containing protein [Streptomyces sp. MUM 178J]|uniref:helix-turn-helix domain-containing protein n=1 Tax=Streptomyces sp. MUM 178J TaxID=2791991 RepID=UPI001F03C88C|nr:helix-turn-helix domain-containing protein [Streptomyces sp. MUM 178J]WRQ82417.1 helix-turn-helix domain-containing protein [Streptomyces sp. MUM 178J]